MYNKKIPNLFVLLLSLFAAGAFAQSEVHRFGALIPDDDLDRVAYSNGYTMLSGRYITMVGPYTGGGATVNATTGIYDPSFPKINGDVYSVVSDGQNGWYVGGWFTHIGDFPISNLAHINPDKTVDVNWTPNPNYEVDKLVISNTTLFIKGYFSKLLFDNENNQDDQDRQYMASFNLSNGSLTDWNPKPEYTPSAMDVSPAGDIVYIGGYFTKVGNPAQMTRNNIAAINATGTGTATGWAPAVNSSIYVLKASANAVYISGFFNSAGGQTRIGLAALNPNSNAATAFVANLGSSEYAYALDLSQDGTLYVGGYFSTIKGVARKNLAAVNATNGNVIAWDPKINENDFSMIYDIKVRGNAVYVAGDFHSVNSETPNRKGFAALSVADASTLAWSPQANNAGYAMAFNNDNTQVFIGGNFNSVNAKYRKSFALINESTGELWPFSLDLLYSTRAAILPGQVYDIAVRNNVLYLGGLFNSVNEEARNGLAAVNLTNGQVLPWNPNPEAETFTPAITTMGIKDNLLYIGGTFSSVTDQPRRGLAAVDLTAGIPNNWNPEVGDGKNPGEIPLSLHIVNNTVYVGGQFSFLGGEPRNNLGALDATSGAPSSWAPLVSGFVTKVRAYENRAYIVGDFANGIDGEQRPHGIAAIDLSSGKPTSWNPEFSAEFSEYIPRVADFTLSPVDIYVAGDFIKVNESSRIGLASFSLTTGNLNTWNPDIKDSGSRDKSGGIVSLASSNTRLFVGGSFYEMGNEIRTGYGEYDICPTLSSSITQNGSTLTAPAGDGYQWYADGQAIAGATSQSFEISILEYGVYGVDVMLNGCTLRPQDYVYLITDSEKQISAVKIYPNPAKHELFIEVPSHATLTMIDLLGKPVLKSELYFQERNRIETHHLKSGAYILQIRSGDRTNTYKIIKTY